MAKSAKKSVTLVGILCFPTSTTYHAQEPQRSTAFKPGNYTYVLGPVEGEDTYPEAVVLTSDEPVEGWDEIGAVVKTRHAVTPKNLPDRTLCAIVFPDGTVEGDLPPKGLGLPHWERVPTNEGGQALMEFVDAAKNRIDENRARAKNAKAEAKSAKAAKAA